MIMKIPKKLSFLLSFLLVFNLVFSNWGMVVKAEETASSVVISSISVDKTSAAAGDKVNVTLDVRDEVNGINKVNIQYKLPSGTTKDLQLLSADGKYTGSIVIDNEEGIIGDWKVNKIQVTDSSGRAIDIYNSEISTADGAVSLCTGDFKVLEEKSQTKSVVTGTEAPMVNSITVDKSTAKVYDNVVITVNMADSLSGINYVSLNYRLPSGTIKNVDLSELNGNYEGSMFIWGYEESGNYKVDNIQFNDSLGNIVYIYNSELYTDTSLNLQDLSGGDLEVTGTTPDIEAPNLNSVIVDKHNASVGDIVTISIDASDDVSGIVYINADYRLPSGDIKNIELTNINGRYIGIIDIGKYNELGNYKLNRIDICDYAGNETEIYNKEFYIDSGLNLQDLSTADIEVTGTTPDLDDPVLNSISVDKSIAMPGDKVTITADAADFTSGIRSVNVIYQLPSESDKTVALTEANGKYTGTLDIDQLDEAGSYIVDRIEIQDNAGRYSFIYNSELSSGYYITTQDLSAGDFQVTGTVIDTNGPVLNNISIDKTSYTAGDVINLTIDASDDLSGIDTIEAIYKDENDNYKEFKFDLINGKYKCQSVVNVFDSSEDWKIDYVYLEDKNGNITIYYNSEKYTSVEDGILKDLSAVDFNIYGTVAENGNPEFKSVTVDKKNAAEGDLVKVTVDAQDYESALEYIQIVYKLEDGAEYDKTLQYSNGYYIGWLNLNDYSGLLQTEYVQLVDKAGNCSFYVNSNLNSDNFGYYDNVQPVDLSGGDIYVSPLSDNQSPVFTSLTTDRKNAVLGDKVKISILANDTGSGLLKANIYYVSAFGQSKEITAKPVGNLLEGYFYVNKYDDSSWKISEIDICDNSMNVLKITNSNTLSSGDLTISGTSPDHTGPVLKDVYTEIKNLEKGQTQKIYIDAADDDSGIKSIEAVFERDNNYDTYVITDFTYENGKYTASFIPSDITENRDFILNDIIIIDNRGNVNSRNGYNIDLTKGNFHYTYNNLETFGEIPIYKSISIDKKSLSSGEELTFTVDAQQATNPIMYCYIEVMSPSGKEEVVPLDNVNGKYIGKLKIMNYFDTGVWKVLRLYLSDEYMNTLVIENGYIDYINSDYMLYDYAYTAKYQECLVDLRNCDFTVAGTNADNKAPVLNSISISKNKAALGDKVKVTVNASDDISGIKSIYLAYSSYGWDYYNAYYLDLNQVSNTQYEGYLDLTSVYGDTDLMIEEIVITDNNNNINYISNNKNEKFYYYESPKVLYNNRDLSAFDISVYYQSELYDLNKDGNINILDAAKAAQSYNLKSSSSGWENVKFNDVNGDNVINLYDLVLVLKAIN